MKGANRFFCSVILTHSWGRRSESERRQDRRAQSLGNAYPPASLSMCVICRQIHTAPGRPRASSRRRAWAAGHLRVGRGTRPARAGRRGCSLRRAGYVRQAAAAASPPAAAAARSVKWSSKCICRWGGFRLFLPNISF